MKLTENQERERIARRIRLTLIWLLFLPTLAVSRHVNSSAKTGDFDGARAYEHVRQLVDIGPRPPASDGIHRAQAYIIGQLKSFGCPVEEHDFHASWARTTAARAAEPCSSWRASSAHDKILSMCGSFSSMAKKRKATGPMAPAFNGKTIIATTLSAAAKWPLKWRSPVN